MTSKPAAASSRSIPGQTTPPAQEEEAYASHKKVYPREVHGLFANLRVLGITVLLGLFYGVAWLPWDGRQAVLLD